jgi:hypothetical protein
MYRVSFLMIMLGVVLTAGLVSAHTGHPAADAAARPAGRLAAYDHAVFPGGALLTETEMQQLLGGQGCFGLAGFWIDNDPTCCEMAKKMMKISLSPFSLSIGLIANIIGAIYYYSSCV